MGLAKNENPNQGAFIIDELTDLVEEAVLKEFEAISPRGGVLGAMETGYQRGKIQEESLYYEHKKHDGSTRSSASIPSSTRRAWPSRRSSWPAPAKTRSRASWPASPTSTSATAEAPKWLAKLKQTVIENGNVFAVLVEPMW